MTRATHQIDDPAAHVSRSLAETDPSVRATLDSEGQFHWRDPGERQSRAGDVASRRSLAHCGGGGARRGPMADAFFLALRVPSFVRLCAIRET